MNKFVTLLTACLLALSMSAQQPVSPNGKLLVTNTAKGITVYYQNNKVLDVPALGYEGFKNGKLKWKFAGMVKADYQMIAGKKSICSNEANEYKAALSSNLQLVLRLYNDGVAEWQAAQGAYCLPDSRGHQALDDAVDRQLRGILPPEHHRQD